MSSSPATTHAAPARKASYDPYGPVHKGIRYALSHLLVRLGTADWRDTAAVRTLLADLRWQLLLCSDHLQHEEEFYHVTLEKRVTGGSKLLVTHHDGHRKSFTTMESLISQLEAADASQRAGLGHALYLEFSSFTADDFMHMHHEETVTLPQFQALFTDEELREMEHALVATIEPDKFIGYMRIILLGMNRDERVGEMTALKADAPAEVFNAVLEQAARAALPAADYADLCSRLGLTA